MSTNSPSDTKQDQGTQEQPGAHDQGDNGHSGEGAASAMAQMISRGRQQRHQTGEADDAAGSQHP